MTGGSYASSRGTRSPRPIWWPARSTSHRTRGPPSSRPPGESWPWRRPEQAMLDRNPAARRPAHIALHLRHNAGLASATILFLALYLIYLAAHPRGFSSAVLVQNSNEAFTLALLAMAQTVPVLLGGLDLSVGAVMTMVDCFASHLVIG